MALPELLERCEALLRDVDLHAVRDWKARHPGKKAIGFLPIYVPRELIDAVGALPVGIMGGGEDLEIIRGDAYFQSYICHLPRSVVEMLLTGRMDCLDGMLFPAICDVIRNLSGMWQMLKPGVFVRYFDPPQNFDPKVGGEFYQGELRALWQDLCTLAGTQPDEAALRCSIARYNDNRRLIEELYQLRREAPWRVPSSESYLVVRASNLLPVDEHSQLLRDYLALARTTERPRRDQSRVLLTGSFCEQPPLGLIKTLERAGCALVDDDFVLGTRFLRGDVRTDGDPIQALADAYIQTAVLTSARYEPKGDRGEQLCQRVRETQAEGVIFAAASFCDPALLERSILSEGLKKGGIPAMACKFSENSGQFQTIREQAGTFSDALKLWQGEA